MLEAARCTACFLEMYLRSGAGLHASECMLYDVMTWVHYKRRGWVSFTGLVCEAAKS